jgi:hypothetical protein
MRERERDEREREREREWAFREREKHFSPGILCSKHTKPFLFQSQSLEQ